jgi:ABC-2 type transport system permease protein
VSAEPSAFSPRLTEVEGPSALGGGWRRFVQLLLLTAVADFRRRYAGSALGYLWTLLRPLLLFGVLYVVITQILGNFAGVPNYAVMLLLNIELIQFFTDATIIATYSLERQGLIRKVRIPQVVMPLSSVLDSVFSLAAGLLIAFVWILAYGVSPMWTWLLFIPLLAALVLFTAAVAMILSSLYVRYRDVAQIWPAIARALFYLTPVIFPIEIIPKGWLTTLESFNPLAPIFVQIRVWVIDPDAQTWSQYAGNTFQLLMPIVLFVAICAAAVVIFSRRARTMAEEI